MSSPTELIPTREASKYLSFYSLRKQIKVWYIYLREARMNILDIFYIDIIFQEKWFEDFLGEQYV